MKTITGLPTIEAKDEGVEFTFRFEDGTTEPFRVAPAFFTDFFAQFSSATFGRMPKEATFKPKYQVAYEGGGRRVMVTFETGGPERLQLMFEDTLADALSRDLAKAAEGSRKKPRSQ